MSNISYQKNTIWNAIAGIVNASQAIIVLGVVSRVNDLKEAGIVALAFSVANLFMTIGKFGMRNYQVAREGSDYTFNVFLKSRIITTFFMILVTFMYSISNCLFGEYSVQKAATISFITLWYAIEAYEDVYAGSYQRKGKLFLGSQIFVLRWLLILLSFIVFDIIFKEIAKVALVAFLIGLICEIFVRIYFREECITKELHVSSKGLRELFKESIPLCIASFLSFYMINMPKYAIDSSLTDELQAIYGYIAMPVFVIDLLSSFIYMPQLTNYVIEWNKKEKEKFGKRVKKQIVLIVFIVIACLAGGFCLGIPVLSFLYNEDLSPYKVHLLILLLGGGFLAVGTFIMNMLTIMNCQKKIMYDYLAVVVFGQISITYLIGHYQLLGAAIGYVITMFLLVVLVTVSFAKEVKKIGYAEEI